MLGWGELVEGLKLSFEDVSVVFNGAVAQLFAVEHELVNLQKTYVEDSAVS